MTMRQKELILALSLSEINRDVFLMDYPIQEQEVSDHVFNLLKDAYQQKDAEGVEYGLLLGFLFEVYSANFLEILNALILEDWHKKHEDLAFLLQEFKSSLSIDVLYSTALKKFVYLNYDDTYALARKCIHALGDINTDESREKLKLLAESDIPIIKEKAEKQLSYYKR